jgi:glycine/D-amino acid oxidase-like deaminating enzyme
MLSDRIHSVVQQPDLADDWPARALAEARPAVFWLSHPDRPGRLPALTGPEQADLAVVGGGYTGLWTALRAKERDPQRDVVIVDAGGCGDQASGRNGGFAAASLTHGYANGQARWPDELATLDRLGAQNLRDLADTIRRYDIDCGWEESGELSVATVPHQADELAESAEELAASGHDARYLDTDQVRAQVDSPTYLAGLWEPSATALVDPARLAWGLRRACLAAGVRIYEDSPVTAVSPDGGGMLTRTRRGQVRSARVALATNAFPPLLRRLRLMTVPVYDYVLVTEPLSAAQRAAVGWANRQGVGDASNLFHYYRLTWDDRILWGGYDAVYHYGSRIRAALEQHGPTHARLAEHFFTTFPQLRGLAFTHRWAGVIDTCTRFTAFFGTAYDGRAGYALGYTGLGVASTRFGADVLLDLLHGEDTERTRLRMVRERPVPFPPEPLRSLGITLTRRSLARADANGGRRNLWLRSLDRFGLGFDS